MLRSDPIAQVDMPGSYRVGTVPTSCMEVAAPLQTPQPLFPEDAPSHPYQEDLDQVGLLVHVHPLEARMTHCTRSPRGQMDA